MNRVSSPKPDGSPIFSAKAVPVWKMSLFQMFVRFSGDAKGRQKGLVDHVCPATFSHREADRKIPLTIVT
jgi:hypothetical protein